MKKLTELGRCNIETNISNDCILGQCIREDIIEKKMFYSVIARIRGVGGSIHARIFLCPFSRSAFLVNKKSVFRQKCHCLELLTFS